MSGLMAKLGFNHIAPVAPVHVTVAAPVAPVDGVVTPVVAPVDGVVTPVDGATDANAAPSLDNYQTLWDNPVDTDGKPIVQEVVAPLGTLDPVKLQEAVKNANLAGNVTAEQLEAISAGGEGAQQALQAVLAETGQASLAQGVTIAHKLILDGIAQNNITQDAKIAALVKQNSVNDNLHNVNPAFSDPAVAPMINLIKGQMAIKNPDATPTQLTQMSQDYLAAALGVLTLSGTPVDTTKPAGEVTDDFSEW